MDNIGKEGIQITRIQRILFVPVHGTHTLQVQVFTFVTKGVTTVRFHKVPIVATPIRHRRRRGIIGGIVRFPTRPVFVVVVVVHFLSFSIVVPGSCRNGPNGTIGMGHYGPTLVPYQLVVWLYIHDLFQVSIDPMNLGGYDEGWSVVQS